VHRLIKKGLSFFKWLRRHPVLRFLFALGSILTLTACVLVAGFVMTLKSRDVVVPAVVRDYVAQQLAQALPDIAIRYDQLRLGLADDWHPQLVLQNVALSQPERAPFLQLSDIQIQFAPESLVAGDLLLTDVSLAGAGVALKRAQDGTIRLRFMTTAADAAAGVDLFDALGAVDASLADPSFDRFSSIDLSGLTVQFDDARANRRYVVDGARLHLSRQADILRIRADMALLSGGADIATLELNYDSPIGQRRAEFGLTLSDMPARDIADQSPALAWLSPLDAPISGALRGGWDDNAAVLPLNATLQIGAGLVQPSDQVRPIPFDQARTYFTYDPSQQSIEFAEISVQAPDMNLAATGYADLLGTQTDPQGFIGQFQFSNVTANPLGLFEQALSVSQASLDFQLGLTPFDLEIRNFYLQDAASGAQVIATSRVRAPQSGWDVAVNAMTEQTDLETVLRFWPLDFKPKPRKWVADNITAALLHDVQFSLRASGQNKPNALTSFWFDQAQFKALKTFPEITGASGKFQAYDYRTTVVLDQGHITSPKGGKIELNDSFFVIPDTRIKPSPAQVALRYDAAIPDLMWLLDHDPIKLMTRLKRDADFVAGRATGQADLNFILRPGLKEPDIGYSVFADLRDVTSSVLIPDRQFAAPALKLELQDRELEISGDASVNQVDLTGAFRASVGVAPKFDPVATVRSNVGQAELSQLGIATPEGLFSGKADAEMQITFAKGVAPEFKVTTDLVGISARLDPLGWAKGKNRAGKLDISGAFAAGRALENISLSAAGLTATGRGVFDGPRFQSLNLDRVSYGSVLDAPVVVPAQGALKILGGRASLPQTASSSRSKGREMTVRLDRLDLSESYFLTQFSADLAANGSGVFRGVLNDRVRVDGRISSKKGVRRVSATSKNAGRVLDAIGLVKDASGGAMNLTLVPRAEGGFDGSATLQDVNIYQAPVLLELLNTLSVVGLLDQLRGAGLLMNEIEAKFRVADKQVIIENATALGPSLGISLNGYYNSQDQTLDMQGVLSPLYVLNGIGSIFTQKGEGLLGFNFNLTGNVDTPRVSVNPMSIFTPAMFRNLFRRPPPVLE